MIRRIVARTRLGRERGAVAIMASVALVFVTGAAALGVDVGKMSYGKRRVQSIADVVALDAVRAVGDRRDPIRDALIVAQEFALTSAHRNDFDPDAPGNAMTVELGVADPNTRVYVPLVNGQVSSLANAVKITVTTTISHAFLPGSTAVTNSAIAVAGEAGSTLIPPSPTPSASATPSSNATVTPSPTPSSPAGSEGGISVGSFMARLDTSKSPLWNAVLGGLVGGNVALDAASYEALIDPAVTVNVGDLLAELAVRVGSPDQVASGTVALADVLAASAAVLSRDGTAESATAATALGTLASSAAMSGLTLEMGEMLRVSGASGSVASAEINALQFAVMAMEAANGEHVVTMNVPVSVPGVASVAVKASFLEAPAIAIGPPGTGANGGWLTQAFTAQARIAVTAALSQQYPVAGLMTNVTVPIYLDGGRATAALASTSCPETSDSATAVHGTTDALRAFVGTVTDAQLLAEQQVVTPAGAVYANVAGVAQVTGEGAASIAGSTADLSFTWPYSSSTPPFDPDAPPAPQTFGSAATNIMSSLSGAITANGVSLGGPLINVSAAEVAAILDAARSTVTGLNATLDDTLKVLDLVTSDGATIGGADATNFQLVCPQAPSSTPAPSASPSPGGGGSASPSPSPGASQPASERRKLIG